MALALSSPLIAQNKISDALNKRHHLTTIKYAYYPSSGYSIASRKGKRSSLEALQKILDQMVTDGILNAQNDCITVFAGTNGSGSVRECIFKCNNGIYLVCTVFETNSPDKNIRKFTSIEDLVQVIRHDKLFDDSYREKTVLMMDTFLYGDFQESVRLIELIASPGEYELYREHLWKIVLENGKVVIDQLISFHPLEISLHFIDTKSIKNCTRD
jgi:hypothetical protein